MRLDFENHRVLVRRRVNVGNLTVAIRAVHRVLDLIRRDAEGERAVAVDIDFHLRTRDQKIAVHVNEARSVPNLIHQLRRPFVHVVQVHALDRHLIKAGRELAVDGDRRRILEKRHDSGHLRQSRAQRLNRLVHGQMALRVLFHHREDESLVAFLRERRYAGDIRIRTHDIGEFFLPFRHRLVRDVLAGLRDAENKCAVLARNKARRHGPEDVNRSNKHQERDAECCKLVAERFTERVVVNVCDSVEAFFQCDVDESMTPIVRRQIPAAQHRRECQ